MGSALLRCMWCIGLATERVRVRLSGGALLHINIGKLSHTLCLCYSTENSASHQQLLQVSGDLHTASGLLCTLGYGEHRRLHQWASQSQGSSHLNESWMICCLRFLSAILIASCVVCVIVEWFSCCFAGWGKWLTAFGFSRSSSKC